MRGILLMAAGMFTFSMVDVQAKYLTQTLDPLQIVWSRQLGLLLGVVIIMSIRGFSILKSARVSLQVWRGIMAAGSASLFIIAVSYVSLAEAVAVSFVAPFFVTVLGAVVLKEKVGIRRWVAVTIGFLATLIVIRPGMGIIHPAAFFVLLAAFFFAIRQILSRMLGAGDPTVTTVAYTAIVSTAILTIPLPFVWMRPTGHELMIMVTMASMAAVAETLVIRALEAAQAVIVAPLQYTMLLWGTLWGYLIFADLPDFFTWVGAAIIVATGAYTLHREHLSVKRKKA